MWQIINNATPGKNDTFNKMQLFACDANGWNRFYESILDAGMVFSFDKRKYIYVKIS